MSMFFDTESRLYNLRVKIIINGNKRKKRFYIRRRKCLLADYQYGLNSAVLNDYLAHFFFTLIIRRVYNIVLNITMHIGNYY